MPVWATVGAAAIGAGTSLYGISKQASDNASAQQANQQAQAAQNQAAWNNYLIQRGLNANGTAPTGVIPSTGATPVNTKLPLWANVDISNGPTRWVKAGTPAPSMAWALNPGSTAPAATGGGVGVSPGINAAGPTPNIPMSASPGFPYISNGNLSLNEYVPGT